MEGELAYAVNQTLDTDALDAQATGRLSVLASTLTSITANSVLARRL